MRYHQVRGRLSRFWAAEDGPCRLNIVAIRDAPDLPACISKHAVYSHSGENRLWKH